ncbi:hypothetical protein TNCV_4546871 [Trichonephila clavipes]|nr:hypothetical protein TNCV_4546871 [Trichonephila clavipes]
MWDALGRQVAGRNYPPTNKNTLIRALTEKWDKLPQQLLDNVVQKPDCSIVPVIKVSIPQLAIVSVSRCSPEDVIVPQVIFPKPSMHVLWDLNQGRTLQYMRVIPSLPSSC